MKTSVIEVRDMLSVLSVLGVEERIGEVPGVESVTVNFSAGSATVRYDETRLDVADIKSGVRQGAYQADVEPAATAGEAGDEHGAQGAPHATPEPAASKTPSAATAGTGTSRAGTAPQAKAVPPAASKSAPDAAASATEPAVGARPDKTAADKA